MRWGHDYGEGVSNKAAQSGAMISDCGLYRYRLMRVWDTSLPLLEWIMLNPSTADASFDDPTIRRCIGFAKLWGYGGIVVHNLYALRATNPQVLLNYSGDAIGPDNHWYLSHSIADCTIVAWGAHVAGRTRVADGLRIYRERLLCLGTTASGAPKHPLYVPSKTTPMRWEH